MIRSVLLFAFLVAAAAVKDDWLLGFEEVAKKKAKEYPPGKHCTTSDGSESCVYNLPMYLPARVVANYTQKIPFYIFQTWKSLQVAGPHAYAATMSFIEDNPEYDYYLFDDDEALNFVCTFHPEYALMYQQTRLGEARADLWRYMVILRYGGIYVDIDSASKGPFRDFIWRDASVVSGIGTALQDLHQWVLAYAPHHQIMRQALTIATLNLERIYAEKADAGIVWVTGPRALQHSVERNFRKSLCIMYTRRDQTLLRAGLAKNATLSIAQPDSCIQGVGIVQIFNGDNMGDHIIYKLSHADSDNRDAMHYSYSKNNTFEQIFQTNVSLVLRGIYTQVGQCMVKGESWRRPEPQPVAAPTAAPRLRARA